MKTLILTFFVAMSSAFGGDFFSWCKDKSVYLTSALYDGARTNNYMDEEFILSNAISETLYHAPKKAEKYFRYTLSIAERDAGLYPSDIERRVYILRFYIKEAIYDLDEIYYGQWNTDAGPYVIDLISRGLSLGYRSPESEIELVFLERTARRSLYFLVDSDFRRSSGYSCAIVLLRKALRDVDNENLSVNTKLIILRNGLKRARTNLSYPSC